MEKKKGRSMSREQASELYRDLRKAMGTIKERKIPKAQPDKGMEDVAKTIAASISKSIAKDGPVTAPMRSLMEEETRDAMTRMEIAPAGERRLNAGHYSALFAVVVCAAVKVALSALEVSGVMTAASAHASLQVPVGANSKTAISAAAPLYSKEEIRILTSLDARRAELEDRSHRLDEREQDISRRDREFLGKLQQLRELTDQLKGEREKDDKKRNAQIEQLANVYGSMAPLEAAALIEQLDITIALPLMEHMPEKRIGQILALMTKERALAITKLLSGKIGEK